MLLIGLSVFNYYTAICINKSSTEFKRKIFFYIGISISIGVLFIFKYYNFFVDSLNNIYYFFNIQLNFELIKIILPLGISFYTFKTMGYLIDVYNEKIEPTTDSIVFLNYVAFFPTILAGPISRSTEFIPQLLKKREFTYYNAIESLRQILWGLFKKTVIADNCASFLIQNQIFENPEVHHGSTLVIGAFVYAIQIYTDFSGYSDMAIGCARLLGFTISPNFNYPFFATSIADFWRKWHISLTSWMTEYVYTPLSFVFRNFGKSGIILAIFVNFILVGLWHGANVNFLIFGLLQGCFFVPLIIIGNLNANPTKSSKSQNIKTFISWAGTITIVILSMVLLRSPSFSSTLIYYENIFSYSIFSIPNIKSGNILLILIVVFSSFVFMLEWRARDNPICISSLVSKWPASYKWLFYYAIILIIFVFAGSNQNFIYLQF